MATLNIKNNFEMTSDGVSISGKQGDAADNDTDAFEVTVTGNSHYVKGTLATASIVTVYDDDDDVPADWVYLYLWNEVDMYIQIIGPTQSVIFKVLAKAGFTLTYDSILAAASATAISGGAEPSIVDIDSIVLGNYSGGPGRYLFAVIQ